MAVAHQPDGNRRPVSASAVSDETLVLIPFDELTCRRARSSEELVQRPGRDAATAILLSLVVCASLTGFRRIDTVQSNLLTVDYERVAVDDRRTPRQDVRTPCDRRAGRPSRTCAKSLLLAGCQRADDREHRHSYAEHQPKRDPPDSL